MCHNDHQKETITYTHPKHAENLQKRKKEKKGEKKHREPKKPIQIYGTLNNKTPNNNNGIMRTVITIIIV